MAHRLHTHDWAATPLGPMEAWPAELRSAAAFVMENRFPAALVWGPHLVTIYNDAFGPILGAKPEALGRSFADVWSEAWTEIGPIVERAMSGRSTFIEDYPLRIDRSGHGEDAFFTFSCSPVRGADGEVLGMIDTVVETTAAVRARKALLENEERLQTVLDGIGEAFYALDRNWRFLFASRSALSAWGKTPDDIMGRPFLDCFPQAAGSAPYEAHRRVMRTGKAETLETISPVLDRWIEADLAPTPRGGLSVAFRDIDGRKRAEQALRDSEARQRVMVAELQHRTRNLLAVVRSIAEQTIRTSDSLEGFHAGLNDRLCALSRVQGLLSRSQEEPITIEALIRTELDALGADEVADRILVHGPEIRLHEGAVQTVALALHELAISTRAYGALLDANGRLRITWRSYADEARQRLALEWRESGFGARGSTTARGGYGRELIERALPYVLQARTTYDLGETELVCTIDLPIADMNDFEA
ncbi:sensor histidine kinase [Methylobacterium frigidaeris]|nr:HWE histidine kinase domain-containing protein [Methylobacterium frigidaeris]